MKAIIQAYNPEEVKRIACGEQTIKVCKTAPKETPFRVYIYMTATKERCRFWEYITAYQNNKGDILNGSQKVIGEFICDRVEKYEANDRGWYIYPQDEVCMWTNEIAGYGKGKPLCGMHISSLKIYDKSKKLTDFNKPCVDKYQYCQGCKYGSIILSDDEEEYALYHGGRYKYFDTVCHNYVTCPPRSWRYVEELEE